MIVNRFIKKIQPIQGMYNTYNYMVVWKTANDTDTDYTFGWRALKTYKDAKEFYEDIPITMPNSFSSTVSWWKNLKGSEITLLQEKALKLIPKEYVDRWL